MLRKVFVTDGYGLIGSHILTSLLANHWHVVAIVQSEAQKQACETAFAYHEGLILKIITQIKEEIDNLLVGITHIIHCAQPQEISCSTAIEKNLLTPEDELVKGILDAAQRVQSIRRIVITSSFAAIHDPSLGLRPDYIYSSQDWNPIMYTQVCHGDIDVAAGAIQALAEKAAWTFLDDHHPSFDLVTLCPPPVYGPSLVKLQSAQDLTSANKLIWLLVSGTLQDVPETRMPLWLDVRDLARAHVNALTIEKAGNKRYAIAAGNHSLQQAADVLRSQLYWAKEGNRVPEGRPGTAGIAILNHYSLDCAETEHDLGIEFPKFPNSNFPSTLVEVAEQIKNLPEHAF